VLQQLCQQGKQRLCFNHAQGGRCGVWHQQHPQVCGVGKQQEWPVRGQVGQPRQ
jgi:hypothetical protein